MDLPTASLFDTAFLVEIAQSEGKVCRRLGGDPPESRSGNSLV